MLQTGFRPFFKETTEEVFIQVADDLLVNSPAIQRYTPKQLEEKFGIIWTNVPMVSDKLAEAMGIPEEPTQTLEEYLKEQGLRAIPYDALLLCNMGETGFGLFFMGTPTFKEINKGDVIVFGGIVMQADEYDTCRASKSDNQKDPMSIGIKSDLNLIVNAMTVRSMGCFAQGLPDDRLSYNKFACANLKGRSIPFGAITFTVLEACRNIKPITKEGIKCGHLLGFRYDDKEDAYFEHMGIQQKFFFNTGEILDLLFAYKFTAVEIHLIKSLLETLPDAPQNFHIELLMDNLRQKYHTSEEAAAINLAGALLTHTKEMLYSFTRYEQEKLVQYKDVFQFIFNDLLLKKTIIDGYLSSKSFTLDSEELNAFAKGPNNALQCLVDEFKVVEKTFNLAAWYIPLNAEVFEARKNLMPYYQLPSKEIACLLLEEGMRFYSDALAIKENAQSQKEKLAEAISVYQEALCLLRNWEEHLSYNLILFEDTLLSITPEIASCYWALYQAYNQLELFPEALYFIERCLFSLEVNKDIQLDASYETIKAEFKKTKEKLIHTETIPVQVTTPTCMQSVTIETTEDHPTDLEKWEKEPQVAETVSAELVAIKAPDQSQKVAAGIARFGIHSTPVSKDSNNEDSALLPRDGNVSNCGV
jgi:hypothetical protein